MAEKQAWPAWYSGPNGETRIFQSADEVPAGWTTGAEKSPVPGASKPAPKPAPPIDPPAPPTKPGAQTVELDAHGHPWSPELYAPTKTKTGAGLWRMKVGKSRPAPVPGYPLDL
jgi:hypothetical protein